MFRVYTTVTTNKHVDTLWCMHVDTAPVIISLAMGFYWIGQAYYRAVRLLGVPTTHPLASIRCHPAVRTTRGDAGKRTGVGRTGAGLSDIIEAHG